MSAESITFNALSASANLPPRIFADLAPIDTPTPYITFGRVGSEPTYTIHSSLAATRVTITVSSWSKHRIEAEQVGDAVVAAMLLAGCLSTERRASYDTETDEFASSIDFDVWE